MRRSGQGRLRGARRGQHGRADVCGDGAQGPDSRGLWCDGGVAIGMQCSAIIYVDGGDKPIFNEDRTVAVVINGEIYNCCEPFPDPSAIPSFYLRG